MSELADITLFERLAPGGSVGDPVYKLTPFAWPSYRRTTAAQGGDVGATFSINNPDLDNATLESWLENWLGYHVEESWGGQVTFVGRVKELRLAYNGLFLVNELASCANKIACRYTSVVDGSQYTTAYVEDTDSQAVYGVREIILTPEDIIGATEALDLAQKTLDEIAWPRLWRGDVDFSQSQTAALQITIEGYAATLDGRHHNSTSTATQDADADISAVLSTADFVTEGTIASNTTQVTRKSDNRPGLQRIRYVAGRRDASGNRYNFGCFRGNAFDYQTAVVDTPRYYLQMKRQRPLILGENNQYIPAPLVQPGGVSLVTDTMSGRPLDSTLLNDPRAQFDEVVEYSAKGARLRGQWDLNSRINALNMATIASRKRI